MTAQRPAIVITRRLAPGIVEVLAGCCEVRQHDSERPMSRAALIDAVPGSAALLTTLADVVESDRVVRDDPQTRSRGVEQLRGSRRCRGRDGE